METKENTAGIIEKFFSDVKANPISKPDKIESDKQRSARQARNKRKSTVITIIQPVIIRTNPKKNKRARRMRVRQYKAGASTYPSGISSTKYDCQKLKGPHGKKAM